MYPLVSRQRDSIRERACADRSHRQPGVGSVRAQCARCNLPTRLPSLRHQSFPACRRLAHGPLCVRSTELCVLRASADSRPLLPPVHTLLSLARASPTGRVSKDAKPKAAPAAEEAVVVETPAPVDSWAPPERVVVKPPNQLELTEEELAEEHTTMLTANNPSAPSNVAVFVHKERGYKAQSLISQTQIHFAMDGWLLHTTSDEAKRQIELDKAEDEARRAHAAAMAAAASPSPTPGTQADAAEGASDAGGTTTAGVDAGAAAGDDAAGGDAPQELGRNQFNYSERAAQTLNNATRDRETFTDPPPLSTYTAHATQWEIYDAYLADQEEQRLMKEQQRRKEAAKKARGKAPPAADDASDDKPSKKKQEGGVMHSDAMRRATRVMERMANQNSFDDIAQDFKYWEDASDMYREGEGTLLPLWKFYSERAKRKHVTSLCWNPEYADLFAVGYGSFDFLRQGSGLVCCYSLKNPSHPEAVFTTESGVMCVDFHPQHCSLLAVGCYDGSVQVFDVRNKLNRPIFQSTVLSGKHTEPVWQIKWQEEDLSKELNFYSVSSDGRVTLWTMSKTELTSEDAMELKLVTPGADADAEDDATLGSLASGCAFDFNKTSDHLFVVGTEEGFIHKCSKAYNSQYMETYTGHNMGVVTVAWNNMHPRMFLSASADWTVKMWDHTIAKPVMTFDLNNAVGDAAWAPYSSSVFAAATSDGKVHVFDLAENRHEAMCEQKVVRKAKLTKLAFNPKSPVLIVGDDRGCVTALKLSPNLRKTASPKDGQSSTEAEAAKLETLVEMALKGESSTS